MTLLQVDALSIATRDGAPLVDGLSFSLNAGERLGIIGESGSGKSLTSLAVCGLLPADLTATGSVHVGDLEVIGARESELIAIRGSRVGIVFQEPLTALDPLMRIGRQLAIVLRRFRGLRGAAIDDAALAALEEVHIRAPKRVLRAFPHEISGGERQRVAIALALASGPEILIADEPTTALDVTVQAEVLDLLDALVAERNMALLFITHDIAVVSRIADNVIVMRSGVEVERGTVRGIVHGAADAYTRDLIASAREFDDALAFGDIR